MAKCSVNFDVITKCSIELDIFYDELSIDVVNDIEEIIKDFRPQILDMVNKKRDPEFVTKHGHKVRLTNLQDIELPNSVFDEIDFFINELY